MLAALLAALAIAGAPAPPCERVYTLEPGKPAGLEYVRCIRARDRARTRPIGLELVRRPPTGAV